MIKDEMTLRLTEAELARDIHAVLARVREEGLDVIVEQDHRPVAVIKRLVAIIAVSGGFLAGQVEGPFELPERFHQYRFPQASAGDCSPPLPGLPRTPGQADKKVFHIGKITVRMLPQAGLQVEGVDGRGGRWTLELSNQPAGCSLWRADLDRNGQEDVIIVTSDLTSGPGVEVTILMIDADGRPVPWQAFGYFDGDHESGLGNLVDLDGDRRAELLYLHVEGERLDSGCTSLGLYLVGNAHWKHKDGSFAGMNFPVRTPEKAKPTEEPDLTNTIDQTDMPLRITSAIPGRRENCGVQLPITRDSSGAVRVDVEAAKAESEACYDKLVLSDGREVNVPQLMVLDRAQNRDFAIVRGHDRLVSQAITRRLPVRLVGRRCDSGCRPFLLWTSEPPR